MSVYSPFNGTLPPNLLPDSASPDWLNKGDNAWQLVAATLVGLQNVRGLIILYWSSTQEEMGCKLSFYGSLCICNEKIRLTVASEPKGSGNQRQSRILTIQGIVLEKKPKGSGNQRQKRKTD
ncbi:ammonium transporter 3 member 1 [Artemisia annua]|uniref:Ammonium transporter 3 member 1 n=1 Tax=Artemisia annua TaxID=35608 RepID=A0A2U1PW21_ARTAN|nr:ammonium transporter 3 member 1 [Artemisia annua]